MEEEHIPSNVLLSPVATISKVVEKQAVSPIPHSFSLKPSK